MNTKTFASIGALGAVLASGLCLDAEAATFSTTKAEFLYGTDYERESPSQFILTLANYTAFTKGDSYFFLDVGDANDRDDTDGIHLEWGPRLSLLRTFGSGQWDGFIKDVYVIGQVDIDGNSFTNKVTPMFGPSVDLNMPGFNFFKVHLQHRDDPTFDGTSVQLNLVWNSTFSIGGQNFSFEGFLDWTSEEGDSAENLLTQPQLLWHPTEHIGVGLEYQYWHNRLGIEGLTESLPQFMVRWTF